MILDFSKMSYAEFPQFYGGEKITFTKIFADDLNKIMSGKLIPGASIGLHTHQTSSEIIFFISGHGKVLMDGAYEAVSAGLCHYCPKNHAHSLINDSDEDLTYFAVVAKQ